MISAFLYGTVTGTYFSIEYDDAFAFFKLFNTSVSDPNLSDPYIFVPPGSGSISHRNGSGSFYRQAKIVRKTLIPTVL